MLTIIEPKVDNGFRECRNFSIPAIKSFVSTLGDKGIKEITSLERKAILGLKYVDYQNVNSLCLRHHYNNSACWFCVSIEL